MIEIEARNIETAIKKAENELGVHRKYIRYEIDTSKTQLLSRKDRKIVIKAEIDKSSYDPSLSPFLDVFKKSMKLNIDFMFKKERENIVNVIITGKDSKKFEKKDGELLIAFQYVLNKVIGEKEGIVVKVDTENKYKIRKEKKIKNIIEKAKKALIEQEYLITNNLNPSDRKNLHIFAEEQGFETESIGKGYYKKVKIFRKDEGQTNNNRSFHPDR